MTFSEKLLHKRRQLGLSQEALAEKVDVSRQAVSRWELGTAMPDAAKLLALSDLFGVSVDALLRDEIDMDMQPAPQPEHKTVCGKRGWYIAGGVLTVLALIGLLIIGILVSLESDSYTPTYEVGSDGVESMLPMDSSLTVFLQLHHLEWLFYLCVACVPLGILIAFLPQIWAFLSNVDA